MATSVAAWSKMSNEVGATPAELEAAQMEELIFLSNAFSSSSATALQRGSQGDWIRLREFLQILQPVGKGLLQFSEVQHYIQRIAEHVTNNQKSLGGLKLIELLGEVFAGVKYQKSSINYPSVDTETTPLSIKKLQSVAERSKPHKTTDRSAIDNNTNNNDKLFDVRWQDIKEKLKPNELSLIDIQRYLPRVLSEISKHEAVWKDALGLTLVAANTEIPCEIEKEVKPTNTSKESPLVSFAEESHFPVLPKQPKNGFAVVESLVRDRAVDVTNIWYLNLADTRHYSPYDLKVVSRKKVKPEHYVISVFGVLHIKPGGESELKSLGKWYREGTVYKTIKKRPFFRNYLIFKTFMLWKRNMKFIKFLRVRKQLKERHLLEVPSMTEAILKVRSLLSEMEQVNLFPTDVDNCYTLEKFNHVVHVILKNAKKFTDKLYNHCQKDVSVVENDCLQYLQYCQFQLEQKTDNIKESMTLARQRRNLQLKNFGVANYVVQQKLPCFVVLVEEMLHQFMLKLISENFARFVHEVMNKQSEERKGLFSADFQFDVDTNLLALSPRPESFLRSLRLSFENVPAVLSEVCVPLTLQMKHGSEDTMISKEIDGDKKLTADELRILLNCGAKEAHETLKQGNIVDGRMQLSRTEQVQPSLHVEQEDQDETSGVSRGEAMQERLEANKMVQDCTSLMNSLMTTAFKEVESFADEHSWLAAIHSFVITWNDKTMQSWKGQTASRIEKQVQQIKTWIDHVRRVDKSMKTSNGILFVDGAAIQEVLVPGLKKILKGMMDMIANHCLLSSEQLITELYDISKSLSTKTSTIEEFTALFQRLKDCKEKAVSLQNRVEYVSSIYEVVRHCYRQLNSDEEDTEDRLATEYNSFLYFMQDANNYVNSLTPQMLETLEKNVSSLEYEAMEITEQVTSGKFLDADENPKDILPELKELHLRFAEIKDKLLKLVRCKDIIKDEPHDLTSLSSMQSRIIARHELWKYCEMTTYTIKDWMHTLFTKLQTKKVVEKVTKWREAVVKLKRDIPSDDEVLCSWIAKIEDFGIDLPLLLELSSVSLKARHWRWLFAGLGQVYDQSYNYLVIDLVSFGLRDHSQQVISICDSAAAEYALEAHLKKLTKKWEEEEFKLMKYFQVNRQGIKVKETGKDKDGSRDMYILTGVNELQSHVEDNLVTLQSMLVSPHLAEMRNLAETWSGYLHQLKEILDMWISCQEKWLYLGKIFSQSTLNLNLSQQREDFDDVDTKFKEHMAAVLKDSKVLSVLEKKRGDKGYRELQGDKLRELFVDVISKEEKIIKGLDRYLDNVRASFPRLYFLSDSEMLELLAISRDPKALVPFVRKCFSGIVNLKFMLPQEVSSTVRTQLDASLNAHKLEVTCFYGQCGEEMNLAKTIQPTDCVEDWLCSIEYAMKSVLWNKMARCFEERFLNTPSITKLLMSIGILQKSNDASTKVQKPSSAMKRLLRDESENAYWFIVHPFQCVLAAEEVIWATNMTRALDPKGFQSISDVRTLVDDAISQYSAALQSNLILEPENSLSKKAIMLIQALLVRALYHQEITKVLDKPDVEESSFEWLQCLKYQIDISHDKRRRIYDRHREGKLIYGASNTAKFGMLRTNQMELSLPYGYEYQGPTTRLAITPLTDRALLNLMTAMKLHYTGGVFGPAQTGKTETMHEVSKILGSNLVTFTCSPSLSISKILHFIAGAIQSGSLICLENVTLLPNTILSVLGQHLECTRHALGSLERRAVSQFETRDANVARSISQENLRKRKRGITVISLHTMTVGDALVDIEFKENEEVKPMRDRGHSIAEIIHITDPRKKTDTKTSHLKESRSEMKIRQRYGESTNGNDHEKVKSLGNVMLGGHLMEANPLFGCFTTIKTGKNHYESVPDNLRNTMRLVNTVMPDYEILIETFLLSNGFKNHHKLARKLACFRKLLRDQFLGDAVYTMSLVQVKAIVMFAGKGCRQIKSETHYADGKDEGNLSSLSVLEGKLEESCLGQAIFTLMFAAVNPLDITNFIRLLKVSFPACKDCINEDKKADELLLSSVKQQIESDSLLDKDEFVNKVMQLHETMFLNRSVILLGAPASGKSACYQTLCRALCQFYSAWTQAVKMRRQKINNKKGDVAEENTSFSKVNLATIYHKAMTDGDLFGEFNKTSQSWSDGLLPKFLRTASKLQHDSREDEQTNDTIQYWFVFDGPLDRRLTDPLESLLDNKNELCLMNGERIKPPDSVRFLFETTSLADSSPAIISRSAIVNFEKGLLDWRCLLCSWKKSARTKIDISNTGIKVVESMLEHINEPLAEFLANDAELLLTKKYASVTHDTITSCLPEISSILQLLAAILERCISRESHEKRLRSESLSVLSDPGSLHGRSNGVRETEEIRFISNAFAYAFVWAVGGRLHERCYSKFDMFSRQLFATCPYSVIFPCTVFDAVFDYTSGELNRWQGNTADVPKTMPSQNYIVCPEIEKYFTIADLLLISGSHVLIVGEQGVGKTAFVKNLLQPRQRLHQILISQGLTSHNFQQKIQRHVQENQSRFRSSHIKPPPQQQKGYGTNKSLFFIDDVSMAECDSHCKHAQPTLEVLRQMMSEGGVYHRERQYFQHLPNLQFIAACTPPDGYGKGGPNRELSPRLRRRMNIINMMPLSDESLSTIYTSVYKAWLEEFPAYSLTHIDPLAKALAYASVEMYNKIKEKFIASPTNPQYVFSHHDLARIAKGVFIYSPKSRLRARKSGHGFTKGELNVIQSMPDLQTKNSMTVGLPDPSLSVVDLQTYLNKHNIDQTPASVSPLIRIIIRLWCHEICRSFYDRITNADDKKWFSAALQKTVVVKFCGEKPSLANKQGILSREASTVEKKNSKNRVKFKDIESTRQADYQGPLITFKHLMGDDQAFSIITFSKHLFIYGARGIEGAGEHEKGYVECLDHHLEEALRKSLNLINTTEGDRLDLVLYKDALYHAARISRILSMPGGHALLVSLNGHGRANIVKLVAKLANIKIMTASRCALTNQAKFRSILKDACYVAGLQGRPIIVYIPEGLNKEGMQDVAAMLVEGTCPGLYTPEELIAIGNHLLPGGQVGQRRTENKMVAQERFLRRIRSNIHIVICAMHSSLKTIIKEYPSVLSRAACVDFYNEWSVNILKEVAERWLIAKGKNEFFYKVPWNLDQRDRQLTAIYDVMAKIHLSSRAALDKDFRRLGLEVFSPLKFVELIDMFRTLCNVICNEREEELSQLTRATDKIQEGKNYIADTEKSISELTPVLEKARQDLKTADAEVKLATKKYHDSKEACADQQNEIENLKIPLERLNDEAKEQFGKVTPLYEAATATLQSLSIYVVEEVRSYRSPPEGVKFVTDTLCLMFGKEPSWEVAKLLLIRENFFYDLLFYKKDEVSDWLYKKLEIYYNSEKSDPNTLSYISQAAQLFSVWIRTVYEYCRISRLLRPKQMEIMEAQKVLKQARVWLGKLRVDSHQMKTELEHAIEIYKDCLKETKGLEKQFQTLNRLKKKAAALIDSMDMYNSHWQGRIDVLKKKLETAPGDALLISALICYLSAFKDDKRDKLMHEWIEYCKEGVASEIPIDKEFSILNLMSSDEELVGWTRKGMPTDLFSLTNALVLRTTCIASKKCWPLLIDRNGQGTAIVKCLEEGMSKTDLRSDTSSSDRKDEIVKRTITSAIMNQKFNTDLNQGRITAKCMRGNFFEASMLSEGFRREANDGRYSVYSLTDDRDSETTRTSDHSDSRTSVQRPYSSFSVITNESTFLKKFYVKTGLKEEPESLPASPIIELQEEVLIVIEIDDAELDRKLKAAIANGLPTLVTHIERGIRSTLLALLIGRSISVSDDGSCYLICEKKRLCYNPNFRLYLSAAVSMNFNKTNRFVLPLHKVLVVNMAVSEEGLTNKLIEMTILSERPSLENPRRSLDLDLFYLRQERKQIHERVLNKIIEMPGKVLEEKSLPALMSETKEQLRVTQERMKEVQQFKDDLEEKRQGYYEVAYHGAMLYRVVSQITELESYYEIPLYFFAEIFKKTLKVTQRLKTESGSVAARAAEISSQFTLDVYKRICLNVFKEHAPLYPILVTAFTLMRQKELDFEHYKMFLELCLMSGSESMIRSNPSVSDEAFILTEEIQARVSALESLPGFTGLADSMRKNPSEWKEYLEISPNLVSSCPLEFKNLATFHKALIWLAVMPKKRTMTCQNLILCSLGPTFTEIEQHNLDTIYKESTSVTPVLVLLPETGQSILKEDPAMSIEAFGKSLKIQVVTISLGLPQQLNEAIRAIKDAIKDDNKWVLLQNCDLESEWSRDFLRLIEEIITTDDESSYFSVEEKPNDSKRKERFRLWMIFKCNEGLTVPIALVKKCLQIAWDEKIVVNRSEVSKLTASQKALSGLYDNTLRRCEAYGSTLPYFGTTSQLKYGKEVFSHLCSKASRHKTTRERNQSFIPCILDDFIFGPAYTTTSAVTSIFCKEDSKRKRNVVSKGKGAGRLHSERDFLESAKAMITLVDDSKKASLEKKTNLILKEINSKIQLIYESLAKKTTSRSLKSMNHFFHREVTFLRNFCDMILQDLNDIQDSTDGGSSVLSAIKEGIIPDDWQSQLKLRSSRIEEWLQEISTLSNSLQSHIRPKSRQPIGYDISLIPHPKGFFASLIEDFCNENLADIGSVELIAQVLQEKEDTLPPMKGVYLKNITLKNSAWDFNQNQLRLEMMSLSHLPILHVLPEIKAREVSKDGPTVTACPLISFEGREIISFKMRSSFCQETVRIDNIQLVSNSTLYCM